LSWGALALERLGWTTTLFPADKYSFRRCGETVSLHLINAGLLSSQIVDRLFERLEEAYHMSHLANLGDVSSSDEESWYDDTAGNLDVFVRLSKAGHFDRAVEYYSQVLKSYDLDFAISASYAASLIEQGAFSDAEAFLDQLSSARKDASAEEHLIIRLFFAITRIYTGCEFDEAAATVCEALQRIGEVDVETAPPLKVSQSDVKMYLAKCFQAANRDPSNSGDRPHPPWTSGPCIVSISMETELPIEGERRTGDRYTVELEYHCNVSMWSRLGSGFFAQGMRLPHSV
jgi:tetratricopeptide (TPR) repeat protein